jgi:shikimate kinase
MKYSVMAHLDLMEMDDIYLSATMMRVYEIIKEEGSFPELDQNKINNWIKKFKERKECYNKLLDEGIKAQEKKKK